MKKKSNYAEKYKDPRWQKKRLEVLERDNWTCQICDDTKSTLHVHHRYYRKGKDIWDYPLKAFITLCESCHESETECLPDALKDLEDAVREHFLSCDIEWLACNISGMALSDIPELVIGAFAWAFSTPEIQENLIQRYINRKEARKPVDDEESKKS